MESITMTQLPQVPLTMQLNVELISMSCSISR